MVKKSTLKKSQSAEADFSDDKKSDRKDPTIRKVPAVTRAIAILRLLGRSDEPMGVNRIARALGLVPSTALHILRVLIAEGFVKFDEQTKLYELDLGVLSIAHGVLQQNRFVPVLQSALRRLADQFGMTMYAVKTMGLDNMNVVASASSNLPIRLHAELGAKFPSIISATGRCVAAYGHYKKSELRQRFNLVNQSTWAEQIEFDEWWERVQQIKKDGYTLDDSNFMVGVCIVAVPILDADNIIYSIVAIGLREQIAHLGFDRVIGEMRNAAAELKDIAVQYSMP